MYAMAVTAWFKVARTPTRGGCRKNWGIQSHGGLEEGEKGMRRRRSGNGGVESEERETHSTKGHLLRLIGEDTMIQGGGSPMRH